MRRTGEAIQWRSRMRTWVGRVTEWQDDGRRLRSKWTELGDDREGAQRVYDYWLESGEAPSDKGRELFEVAARRVVSAAEKQALKEARLEAAGEQRDRAMRLTEYAAPVMGHVEVARVEGKHVASVLDAMAGLGKSKGYILKMRSDISQVFVALIREGARKDNPAREMTLPARAKVDGRERSILTDSEILLFRERRGFAEEIDMACLLARDLAGERTSDALAHDWSHVNFATQTILVRRPKTDGETGGRVSERKLRSYELVEHGIPPTVLGPLEAWWKSQGSPASGPVFPLRRDSRGSVVTLPDGRSYERRGSKAGERKARSGNSFCKAVRAAAWEAKIYRPLPGFDPEKPDKRFCSLQTDTAATLRLDFQGMRGAYGTALADAGVDSATRLALMGHTQETTQTRHYQKRRRVETPAAALPGGKKAPAPTPLDAVMAELGRLRAALTGTPGGAAAEPAPGLPQESRAAPRFGADESTATSRVASNYSESLASPKGIEPMTNALGMPGSGPKESQLPLLSHAVELLETPLDGGLPHVMGQASDPDELLRATVSAMMVAGDIDAATALLEVARRRKAPLPDNIRKLGSYPTGFRKGKS